ncbi:MAG TPA: response regulator transcription factor [Myxococcales bacterium]|nr:response regulator transcription factor [Myxococcales bacterium]
MEVQLPGLDGFSLAERISKDHPGTSVIMMSIYGDDDFVRPSLQAGAAGYLLTTSDAAELGMAVRAVARGDMWLTPAVARKVAAGYAQAGRCDRDAADPLTRRQREILQLIAEGHTTRQIARSLEVSTKTVDTHRAELMERLGIRGVAGLVRYAVRIGLVDRGR